MQRAANWYLSAGVFKCSVDNDLLTVSARSLVGHLRLSTYLAGRGRFDVRCILLYLSSGSSLRPVEWEELRGVLVTVINGKYQNLKPLISNLM